MKKTLLCNFKRLFSRQSARFLALLLVLTNVCCLSQAERNPLTSSSSGFPHVILWAWERPENLEFVDSNKYAVAFLSQTLVLQNDEVILRPRRQPLKVNPNTKLIAVTRIETEIASGKFPVLSAAQQTEIVEHILKTLKLSNVSAIQIDFDAAVSEREFYRNLLIETRQKLPAAVPLSITALASFCLGDRWFKDLPIAEAVPMLFRMGADDKNIKNFLAGGGDFAEPLCQNSYGIAIDEPVSIKFARERRIYVFNTRAWTKSDVEKIKSLGIE